MEELKGGHLFKPSREYKHAVQCMKKVIKSQKTLFLSHLHSPCVTPKLVCAIWTIFFKDGTKMDISYDRTDFSRDPLLKTRIGILKTNIQLEFVFKSQGVEYKRFSCKSMGSIGQNFAIWFCTILQN